MNNRSTVASHESVGWDTRPQRQLHLGLQLVERDGTEGAIRAFQAALGATLHSGRPEDVRLRRAAADQLVRLLRKSAAEVEVLR